MHPSLLSAIASGRTPIGEDLLTGLILGHLATEADALPEMVNAAAAHLPGEPLPRFASLERLAFWPWWSHHAEVVACEPDAELVLRDGSGRRWLLAVEAKLGAQKSGNTLERDQLMRQVANGPGRAAVLGATFAGVLFLTADSSRPVAALEESTTHLKARGLPLSPLLWTNWSWSCAWLAQPGREPSPVEHDLIAILRRLGQGAFAGWPESVVAPDWQWCAERSAPPLVPWTYAAALEPPVPPPWTFDP